MSGFQRFATRPTEVERAFAHALGEKETGKKIGSHAYSSDHTGEGYAAHGEGWIFRGKLNTEF